MTTFDRREQGFEAKFVVDEELRFKATARRNRLLGDWAAAQLGLVGDNAKAYAKALVTEELDPAGRGDILSQLSKDLAQKGISAQQIHEKMGELFHIALAEMKSAS